MDTATSHQTGIREILRRAAVGAAALALAAGSLLNPTEVARAAVAETTGEPFQLAVGQAFTRTIAFSSAENFSGLYIFTNPYSTLPLNPTATSGTTSPESCKQQAAVTFTAPNCGIAAVSVEGQTGPHLISGTTHGLIIWLNGANHDQGVAGTAGKRITIELDAAFIAKSIAANQTVTAYAMHSDPFSGMVVTGQYKASGSVVSGATVTFNGNNGSGSMAPQIAGNATPLSSNTFTRPGFAFTGWNTAANGTGTSYADGASYAFTASATLYAQWQATPRTVTFDPNGGAGSMAPVSSITPAVLPANTFTTTELFAFNGWNTAANGSGTAYSDQATFEFSEPSTTLFAQWTALPITGPPVLLKTGEGISRALTFGSSSDFSVFYVYVEDNPSGSIGLNPLVTSGSYSAAECYAKFLAGVRLHVPNCGIESVSMTGYTGSFIIEPDDMGFYIWPEGADPLEPTPGTGGSTVSITLNAPFVANSVPTSASLIGYIGFLDDTISIIPTGSTPRVSA